jgi:hypothetical protein
LVRRQRLPPLIAERDGPPILPALAVHFARLAYQPAPGPKAHLNGIRPLSRRCPARTTRMVAPACRWRSLADERRSGLPFARGTWRAFETVDFPPQRQKRSPAFVGTDAPRFPGGRSRLLLHGARPAHLGNVRVRVLPVSHAPVSGVDLCTWETHLVIIVVERTRCRGSLPSTRCRWDGHGESSGLRLATPRQTSGHHGQATASRIGLRCIAG